MDDLAQAVIFLLDNYNEPGPINVGFGEEVSIRELAQLIAGITGFEGEIAWDVTRPDGTPRKLLDSSRLRGLGWEPKTSLSDGVGRTYDWLRTHEGIATHRTR